MNRHGRNIDQKKKENMEEKEKGNKKTMNEQSYKFCIIELLNETCEAKYKEHTMEPNSIVEESESEREEVSKVGK